LCQAADGKLYGMTYRGGTSNEGVLFEYDLNTGIYSKKIDFLQYDNGRYPYGSLVYASNSKLYGMVNQGGGYNLGALFEYNPATETYVIKVNFAGATSGRNPNSTLIQASNGKLYGMANGGTSDMGVLFEFNPSTSTYVKIIDFAGSANGQNPQGALAESTNGKLYGMTSQGGANGLGVLFEYDPSTKIFVKKIDFAGTTNGSNPYGSLMQASDGKMYGMTNMGGANGKGVLFSYDPLTETLTKKIDFNGTTNGGNPFGTLVQALNGLIYGVTSGGGSSSVGVLFEYNPTTESCVKRIDFAGVSNGSNPRGSLILASNGKLYGMTYDGGAYGKGVLFEFDPVSSTCLKRFDFENTIDGKDPYSSLMLASNGRIYGTTINGGTNNMGVIFEYNPVIDSYSKKIDFNGANNGRYAYSKPMQASNNKIYGMTLGGGSSGVGVLYEYDITTNSCVKKVDFTGTNGSSPFGALIQATNGKLYGMTRSGGLNGIGVLIEYDPSSEILTKRLDFAGATNGSNPRGALLQASDGKLYGMTYDGGSNNMGVIFEFDPSTNTYTKKIDFAGAANGSNPYGSLIEATNGKLYGLTYKGGLSNYGVLFEYDISTGFCTKKFDFDGTDKGFYPYGSLIQAANGKLYGVTYQGGINAFGVLFEYDIINNICTKKQEFSKPKGALPYYVQLLEVCAQPKFTASIPDVALCQGANTEFVTVTTGNGLTYQWQSDEGSGFADISDNAIYSGTRNDTLDISGVLASMNNFHYRCVVTSSCPLMSIYSDTARLNVYTSFSFNESQDVCSGDSILWQGSYCKTTGTYNAGYTTTYGCDSIYTLNLKVNPVYAYTENHSICNGDTFNWHGTDYAIPGIYTASYVTVNGCDSIYTLSLTVNPFYSFSEDHSICEGEAYNWQGTDYKTPGTYTASYVTVNGCDSIYILNLAVNPVYSFSEDHSICEGEAYNWQGTDYTTSGIYTASYSTVNGCDSIYILNLIVNPVYSFSEDHSICEGEAYNWQGTDYKTPGTYTASYVTVNGCDSIYILNLAVNPVYSFSEDRSICEGETYNWQGNTFTDAGTYTVYFTTTKGCDSTFTLNLSVNTVDTSVVRNGITLSANASDATFQWLNCGNNFSLLTGETNQNFRATFNGIYAVEITQNNCIDTSACFSITAVSIAGQNSNESKIYPNPFSNEIIIEMAGANEMLDFEILNAFGQIIYKGYIMNKTSIQTSHLVPGVYLVKIGNGKISVNKKIIKE
jgi:uncharacterized repeat protein (TIGR03803 family)